MFVPCFLWDQEARQLQLHPVKDKWEKTHIYLMSITGSDIRGRDNKADGTYRRSRRSWRTTRSQQTSRTLWGMRKYLKIDIKTVLLYAQYTDESFSVGKSCPLVDTFVKEWSDARESFKRILLQLVGVHHEITWWSKTNSRQVLHSRQLILWARSLHPRPKGRKRQKSGSIDWTDLSWGGSVFHSFQYISNWREYWLETLLISYH